MLGAGDGDDEKGVTMAEKDIEGEQQQDEDSGKDIEGEQQQDEDSGKDAGTDVAVGGGTRLGEERLKNTKPSKAPTTVWEKSSNLVEDLPGEGHPLDEGEEGTKGREDGAKKKNKKKKKKRSGEAVCATPCCPGGVGSKVAPGRGVKGFTDSYVRCDSLLGTDNCLLGTEHNINM